MNQSNFGDLDPFLLGIDPNSFSTTIAEKDLYAEMQEFLVDNPRTEDEVGVSRCWGYDSDGQTSNQPQDTFFFALSAGGYHTCAIKAGEV
jgi:hypothetical protein